MMYTFLLQLLLQLALVYYHYCYCCRRCCYYCNNRVLLFNDISTHENSVIYSDISYALLLLLLICIYKSNVFTKRKILS